MPTPIGIYSASGISSILGCNPYSTRLEAWQRVMEKLKPGFNAAKGYTLPEFPDNAPIRWGNAFEDAVIKLAEEKDDHPIIYREKIYKKSFGEVELTCHIDGMYAGTHALHEGKTTNARAFTSVKGEDYNVELEQDDETGIYTQTEFKRRWGDPGTDQVPEEYQIQTAVQRICSGAELVKLSVLVFPKATDEFEKLGWTVSNRKLTYKDDELTEQFIGDYSLYKDDGIPYDIMGWAKPWAQQGNFHTYLLPSNPKLEALIIEKVQEFDAKYVKTELPPAFEDYADVRRLMTSPMGTIIATPDMITLAREYSEIVRQLGKKGPMVKRQETLKVEIMNWMNTQRKNDWTTPNDKLVLIDPNGGDALISFGKQFRAKGA